MKKLLLSIMLFAGVLTSSAQNEADFNTLKANSSYSTYTTTNGWKGTNCCVVKVGDEMALAMNGKKTSVGSITSPLLNGGLGTVSFNYTNTFGENNGVSLRIDVKQGDDVVGTETLTNKDVTQNQTYSFTSKQFDVEGEYTIVLTNLSPSNSTSNKDRVSIYNLTWTNFTTGTAPTVKAPKFTLDEGETSFSVSMSCEEGASIYYTMGTESIEALEVPTAESTPYTTPVEVKEKTYFKAVAVNGSESSYVASFTANPPLMISNFASLAETADKTNILVKGQLTAAFQNGNNLYVADSEGNYMLVFGKTGLTLQNGDSFSRLEGVYELYNELPEITSPVLGETTAGTPLVPVNMELAQITKAEVNRYVKLSGVDICEVKELNGTLSSGEVTLPMYNKFKIDNYENGKACDIEGFVSINYGTLQFCPTAITVGEIVVAVPQITPADGANVVAGTEVVLTAEEGAVIYAKTSADEDFAEYSEITVSGEIGSTFTVEAYAEIDGTKSETVSVTYNIIDPAEKPETFEATFDFTKFDSLTFETPVEYPATMSAGAQIEDNKIIADDVVLSFTAEPETTGVRFWRGTAKAGDSMRIYKGSTISVSAPAEFYLIDVDFTSSDWGLVLNEEEQGTLEGKKWSAEYTDQVSSVTFNVPNTKEGKNTYIQAITVKCQKIKTAVSDIEINNGNAPVEYYNLQGIRVMNPENGLYIRRQGNKVSKVIL